MGMERRFGEHIEIATLNYKVGEAFDANFLVMNEERCLKSGHKKVLQPSQHEESMDFCEIL